MVSYFKISPENLSRKILKYVYLYVCMLSLRRVIASACAAGVVNIIVGDAQRVADRGQSCTAGSIWFHTIRVPRRTLSMQVWHDCFLPGH